MAEVDIPAAAVKFVGEGGLVRRNSTGNFNSQPSTPKILPHYLRASTGSCHDFCKHGFAHVTEATERNLFSGRFAPTPEKRQHQARSVTNPVQRKKKSVFTPKVSPDLKSQTPYKCKVIMGEVPKSTKNVSVSSKQTSDLKLKPLQTKVISLTAPSRLSIRYTELILPNVLGVLHANSNNRRSSESKTSKDTEASKTSRKNSFVAQTLSVSPKASMKRSSTTKLPSFSAPGGLSRRLTEIIMPKVQMSSSSIRNSEIEMINKMGTSKTSSKIGLVSQTLCLSPKSWVKEVLSTKSGNIDDPQKFSPVKDQNSANFAETEQPDVEVVAEKTLYVVEPEAENLTVGLAENDSLTSHSPLSAEGKGLIYDQNEAHASPLPPSLDNENLNCNHDVIKTAQSPPLSPLSSESKDTTNAEKGTCNAQSLPSTSCATEYVRSDQIDPIECSETKPEKQIVEQEHRPRRIRRVVSDGRINALQKVKFSQGKGVNVQSENSSPRKIKFRQGNMLDNQNGKADNGGRRLRRLVSDGVSDKTKAGPAKKVVLRHQEVKGRMVSSRSFNNVIEETASKLVESRKSKVKALVGAFETVISLQDRKSSKVASTG